MTKTHNNIILETKARNGNVMSALVNFSISVRVSSP